MDFNTLLISILAKIGEGVPERRALLEVVTSVRLYSMETERLLTFLTWGLAAHRRRVTNSVPK
ncbi:MAG: hypothetical protein UY03_C0015G0057 [Parcubacteria group bacterium GW2011_GWA2_47_64]|nr:MAG: hypothetical protein UY03_C0015G0057 [Parcubacteria group bacterium GW2011_GWA2_47_64]KKU95445.1 MAG: hypothetical protein UY29_C0027G0007 [Parcubacteria group bacterium GW2011_GWC2_48_17]